MRRYSPKLVAGIEWNTQEAYDSGEMQLTRPTEKEILAIKAAAESTFKKDKRVTIGLYDQDYKGIQKKHCKWQFLIKFWFQVPFTAMLKAT